MTEHTAGEPTLEDVQAESPRWHCWRGICGLLYARLPGSSPAIVIRAEDGLDLRDQIRRAESDLRHY